jgi:hypothetical protein
MPGASGARHPFDRKVLEMVSLTVVMRQELAEWVLVATVTESYGDELEPVTVRAVWKGPLTNAEWDSDPLWATLSGLRRWSDLTMSDLSTKP